MWLPEASVAVRRCHTFGDYCKTASALLMCRSCFKNTFINRLEEHTQMSRTFVLATGCANGFTMSASQICGCSDLVAMVMHCGMQRRCRDSALGVAVCERRCNTSVATVAARCCAISMLLLCTRCATVLPPSFTTAYQRLLQVCIIVLAACTAR